ncbi:hypothetical protein EON68_04945 [archaeon]|nr:MAG: hypothetical protein EON68_04945 [archaeon]
MAKAKAPLANEGIKFPEVRLINAAGENLNVVPIERARALAAEAGMDLVVTALHATPPVCRIMRMAAVMEKLKKAASAQRASQKHSQPKEMRYTARITGTAWRAVRERGRGDEEGGGAGERTLVLRQRNVRTTVAQQARTPFARALRA